MVAPGSSPLLGLASAGRGGKELLARYCEQYAWSLKVSACSAVFDEFIINGYVLYSFSVCLFA